MAQKLQVFEKESESLKLTSYFEKILGPAINACRFSGSPPAVRIEKNLGSPGEFRPWNYDDVFLDSDIVDWSQVNQARVYLHECAHSLCFKFFNKHGCELSHAHGPIFCMTANVLYGRASHAPGLEDLPLFLSFYEFSDCPPELIGVENWRSEVVRYVESTTELLADSKISAEEIPELANGGWVCFLQDRKERLDRAKVKNQGWILIAGAGWFLAAGCVFLLFRIW